MGDTIVNSAIAFDAAMTHGTVSQVYSGRHGCSCGCRGNHTSSARSIATVTQKMIAAVKSGEAWEIMVLPGVFVSVTTHTREYIAYLDGRVA
jgi:hypothetical protein